MYVRCIERDRQIEKERGRESGYTRWVGNPGHSARVCVVTRSVARGTCTLPVCVHIYIYIHLYMYTLSSTNHIN